MQRDIMNKINMEHGQIRRRKKRFWAFLLAVLVLTTSMSPALVMAADGTIYHDKVADDNLNGYVGDSFVNVLNGNHLVAGDKITLGNFGVYDKMKVQYFDFGTEINYALLNDDGSLKSGDYPETIKTGLLKTPKVLGDEREVSVVGTTDYFIISDYEDFKNITHKSNEDVHFGYWEAYAIYSSGYVTRMYFIPKEADSNGLTYYNVEPGEHQNPERFYRGYKVVLTPAERDGYIFEGWYTEANFVNKVTEIPAEGIAGIDYMFYAKWSEACTVTFDSDGGTAVDPQKLRKNEKAEKPDDPKKEGYTFKGWFLNDEEYDFNTPVTANITLKAKWEKNEEEGGGGEGGEGGGGNSKGSDDSIPFDTTGRLLQVVVTKRTDTSLTISWNQITGADGYRIYGHKCYSHNVDFIKDVTDLNNLTFTWENLEKDSYYKFVVKAYKKVGKRKKNIAKSIRVHATTTSDTYTVAKTVEIESVDGGEFSAVSGNSLIMSKGKSATITAKEVLEESSKTIEEKHRSKSKKVTWLSNDLEVVKISKKGKIKAVAPGECIIYGTAQNGVFVPVKVTVK